MSGIVLQSVIETQEFITQAKHCMTNEAKVEFINFIAGNPLTGDIMAGTGGARKIRWQSDCNSGKRGGVRIIYYFHDENIPIYLFTVYKKNQRDNISSEEKNILHNIIKLIVKEYQETRDE